MMRCILFPVFLLALSSSCDAFAPATSVGLRATSKVHDRVDMSTMLLFPVRLSPHALAIPGSDDDRDSSGYDETRGPATRSPKSAGHGRGPQAFYSIKAIPRTDWHGLGEAYKLSLGFRRDGFHDNCQMRPGGTTKLFSCAETHETQSWSRVPGP